MKKVLSLSLIISALLIISAATHAQVTDSRSYVVMQTGGEDTAPYTTALESANLDRYRLVDERRVLVFDNGFQVELLSSNELNAMGISFDPRRIITDNNVAPLHPAVFKLAANGYILESYAAPETKASKTRQ